MDIHGPMVPLTTENHQNASHLQNMPGHLAGEINFRRSSSSGAGGGFAGVALRCISASYHDIGSLKSANLESGHM